MWIYDELSLVAVELSLFCRLSFTNVNLTIISPSCEYPGD